MSDWWSADPVAGAQSPQPVSSPYAGAISKVESGGRYNAVGPETGKGRALGKYQVMDFNVGPWTKEALGVEMTPQQFLASPEAQDAVFNAKFGSYVDKYGPEGAAKAWFAGEKGMNNPNARDILGTSVTDYARKFTGAMGPGPAMAFAPPEPRRAPVSPIPAAANAGQTNWWDSDPVAEKKPAAKPEPTVGMGEAIGRGVQQGVTFNFGDEMRGLIAAGGGKIGSDTEPAGPHNILIGAYRLLASGDPEAKRIYEETVAKERAANKTAEEQRPNSTLAGNVLGAVAMPLGGLLGAATLPARMARGAAVGAGTGALYGAGEGENVPDRASRALTGAGVGFAVGGVAPPVVEGVIRGARSAAQPIANAIRGITSADDEAARRIALATQKDAQIDPAGIAGLTAQEFKDNVSAGGPARILDLGGEHTRALARSAANTSPEGRQVLNAAINDRFEGQTQRVTDWMRTNFGNPNANMMQDAIELAARGENRVAYGRAYRDGSRGVFNDELEQLGESPVMRQAIREAAVSIGNKRATGRAMHPVTSEGKVTLEYWDQVKRSLDGMHSRLKRAGDSEAAADIDATRKSLLGILDREVPSYAQARKTAASWFGGENALEAGQKFVRSNADIHEARKMLAKMSPEERKLFQEGFVSEYIDVLNRTGDRRNILNKIGESPAAREKLKLAIGAQKADELETVLRVEGIMDLARGAVQGNSTTARQLAEIGLAGGTYGVATGGNILAPDAGAIAKAALVYGAARGKAKINENLSKRVAELLVSNDPKLFKNAITIISRNKEMFNSLRAADKRLAIVGGEQGSGIPVMQSMSAGRAEDDQANVPRPRGQ